MLVLVALGLWVLVLLVLVLLVLALLALVLLVLVLSLVLWVLNARLTAGLGTGRERATVSGKADRETAVEESVWSRRMRVCGQGAYAPSCPRLAFRLCCLNLLRP